jgi:hypothetical protein
MSFQKVQNLLRSGRIAPFLDIALPASVAGVVRCPFCGQNGFHVQQHPEGVGEWQHCFKCNRQGTPLTIAAELLGQNIAETVRHLLDAQGATSTPATIAEVVQREESELQVTFFWQAARNALTRPELDHVVVLQRLGWAAAERLLGSVALRGPGQHIGLCQASEAAAVGLKLKRSAGGTVVVPYFSHLDQLLSLQLITPTQQLLSVRHRNNLGFAFYRKSAFHSAHRVYISSLLRVVGMLHVQADVRGERDIPVAAWQDSGTPIPPYHTSNLIGHSVVMLEPTLTPSVVQLAMEHDAKIYFLPHRSDNQFDLLQPAAADLANWCTKQKVSGLLQEIAQSALPLPAAIKVWRKQATQADISLLLRAAAGYPEEVRTTICKLLASPARKIYYNTESQQSPIIIETTSNPVALVEKNQTICTLTGSKVFPGIIRVDNIVDRAGDPEYRGQIITTDSTIDFIVRKSELTYSWFYTYLNQKSIITRHLKQISVADRVSAEHLLSLAIQQKAPVCYAGFSKLGWDGEGFQYAKMRIEAGRVTSTPSFLIVDSPGGPSYSAVKPLRDIHYIYQQNSDTAAQAWAWALAISAIATAPVVGLPPIGLILEDVKFTPELRAVMQQFGCRIRAKSLAEPSWFYYRETAATKKRQYKLTPWMVCLQHRLSGHVDKRSNAYRLSCDKLATQAAALRNMLMPVMQYLKYFTKHPPSKEFADWQSWHAFSVRNFGKCFASLNNAAIARKFRFLRLQHD